MLLQKDVYYAGPFGFSFCKHLQMRSKKGFTYRSRQLCRICSIGMISVLAFFQSEGIFCVKMLPTWTLWRHQVKARILHNSERGKRERNEDGYHCLVLLQLFPLLHQTQYRTASVLLLCWENNFLPPLAHCS